MTEGESMLDHAQPPRERFSAYTPVFNISEDGIDVLGFLRGLTARNPHEKGGATCFVAVESKDASFRIRLIRNKPFRISLDLIVPEGSMPNSNSFIHYDDSELTDGEKKLFISRIPQSDLIAATTDAKDVKDVHGSIWFSLIAPAWTKACAETELLPETPVIKTEDEPAHGILAAKSKVSMIGAPESAERTPFGEVQQGAVKRKASMRVAPEFVERTPLREVQQRSAVVHACPQDAGEPVNSFSTRAPHQIEARASSIPVQREVVQKTKGHMQEVPRTRKEMAVDSCKLTAAAQRHFCKAAACLSRAARAAPALLVFTPQSSHEDMCNFQCKLSDMIDGLLPDVLAWQIGPAVLLGRAVVKYSCRIGLDRYLGFPDLCSPAGLMPEKQDWGPGSCFALAALQAVVDHVSEVVKTWVKEANEMARQADMDRALRVGMSQSPEARRPRTRGHGRHAR